MCANHHRHQLDRFLTKACAYCMVAKPFDAGVVQTERFRYRITNGKRKLVKKHWDSLREW